MEKEKEVEITEVVVQEVEQVEYTFTKTAAKHFNEVIKSGQDKGKLARPYMNSPLTIREIIATGNGLSDATAKNALNFKVPGTFKGSQGTWELVIDIDKKMIYHFLFRSGIV